MSSVKYMVINEDGEFVALERTASAARSLAESMFDNVVDDTGGLAGGTGVRSNPVVKGQYVSGRRFLAEGQEEAGPSLILTPDELAKPVSGRTAFSVLGLPQVSEEAVVEITDNFTSLAKIKALLGPILVDTGLGKALAEENFSKISHSMIASNYKMSKGRANRLVCPSCSTPDDVVEDPETGEMVEVEGTQVEMVDVAPPDWTAVEGVRAGRCPKCGITSRIGTVRGLVLTPYYFGLTALDNMASKFGPDAPPGEFFGTAAKNKVGLETLIYPILEKAGSPNAKFYKKFDASTLTEWTPVHVGQSVGQVRTGWDSRATMCAGSSAACRAGCLALTGQQLTNFGVKLALTKAMFEQPVAFCALLTWATKSFFGWRAPPRRRAKAPGEAPARRSRSKKTDVAVANMEAALAAQGIGAGGVAEPGIRQNPAASKDPRFIRLNVISDVPWEVFFPALFDLVPNMTAYDYTKVTPRERDIPDNYDLTFSFNGTNWPECERVLADGRRVAVVFAPLDPSVGHTPKTRLKGLPERFMGYRVVDGDGDDMRALDAVRDSEGRGIIVGLRYKKPKKVAEHFEKFGRYQSGFVVPVSEVEGFLIAAHNPRHNPSDFLTEDEREAQEIIGQQKRRFADEYGGTALTPQEEAALREREARYAARMRGR